MNIVKHSQRTNRKPCRLCGLTTLYWGHDLDRPGNRPCEESKCEGHGRRISWVLLNADGRTPHAETCSGTAGRRNVPAEPEPSAAETAEVETMPAAIPPVVVETQARDFAEAKAEADNPGKVLADMVRPYIGIDADEIDNIVAEAWAKRAVPQRIVIENRETGTEKIVNGAHHILSSLIRLVRTGEHVMLVGPAGTGKSTLAKQVADALDRDFYQLSLSPTMSDTALRGFINITTGEQHVSDYEHAYVKGNSVFLLDEMDNANPAITTFANSSLSNGHCAFAGGVVTGGHGFTAIATANTYGRGADRMFIGRHPIDVATADRFTFVTVDYDEGLEDRIAAATGYDGWSRVVEIVRAIRKNAFDGKVPVVVSPRATRAICAMLAEGLTWEFAVDARLRRGLDDATWAKLTDGVKVTL